MQISYQFDLPVFFPRYRYGVLEQHRIQSEVGPKQRHGAKGINKHIYAHLSLVEVLHTRGRTLLEVLPLADLDRGVLGHLADHKVEEYVLAVVGSVYQLAQVIL